MKRIRPNYHNLHVMKDARRKLRRAILANSDKELLDTVCECSLNVLQGNVKLSNCKKRKIRKFRRQLRTVADRHVPLARKKKFFFPERRVPSSPPLSSTVYDSITYLRAI